jgi:hypothetical protein
MVLGQAAQLHGHRRALLQASGALVDLELGLLAGDAAERKRIAPHAACFLSRIARPLLWLGNLIQLLATRLRQTSASCTDGLAPLRARCTDPAAV